MQHETRRQERRNFLLAAGAAAGGFFLAGCGSKEDPYRLEKPPLAGYRRGEEKIVTTACGQCPAGCSIRVRRVEGRAVKCAGNPECPINKGGIGPRGQASLQVVYDPDRIHQPLKRVGDRGSANFQPIAWEEAIAILAERLTKLRNIDAAHRTAIFCGRERGMMHEFWQRFAHSYGTPNFFDGFSHGNAAVAQAFELVTGNREIPAYDWPNAEFILSLDSGMLESSCQISYFTRARSQTDRAGARARAKIVHVGQAFTRTGINADQVVMVTPGALDTFVLGLCRVLVDEKLYDADYLHDHVAGFEPWTDKTGVTHLGFKNSLDRYSAEYVQARTGVRPKLLRQIALDMAACRPAFAITGPNATLAFNGLQVAWSTLALNTLLGAIHRPGGLLIQQPPPLADWPAVNPDARATAGRQQPRIDGVGSGAFPLADSVIEAIPEALAAKLPYAIDTLLLYYANPIYSKINPQRWTAALRNVPFIVSFSPFLDETAAELADLILPDHTFLERWEDAAPAPATGYAVYGVRQPVLDQPVHDTLATGDLLIELAGKIGDPVAADFKFKDFKDAVLKRVIGIYKAKRGSIVNKNGGKFLQDLFTAGFWADDTYEFADWGKAIRTASGKIELASSALRQKLLSQARTKNLPIETLLLNLQLYADLDQVCMPHERANRWYGDERNFPLLLLPYKPNTYAVGSGANLPLLQELPLFKGRPLWTTEAQLHPETAARYGIASGDRIEIESPVATISVPVLLTSGIVPGVVRVPQGGGHTAFGRWALGRGANVMRLLSPASLDPCSGISPVVGTRVRVRKATV